MSNGHQSLKAEGLYKKYGTRMVVKDVDVSVGRKEVVGLLGPNGAGKTTTFYMITGMIKPSKGDIFLDDENITQDAMYIRARKGIGYLAQEPSIFSKLSVENNLKLVLEMRKELSYDEQQEKLDSLLNDLSVNHLRNFILLDEPFAGVDPIAVEEIQAIIDSLREREIGVLVTDHNVRETLSITDRSYLLFEGQILKSGTSEFLAADDEARRLYLGEKFNLD